MTNNYQRSTKQSHYLLLFCGAEDRFIDNLPSEKDELMSLFFPVYFFFFCLCTKITLKAEMHISKTLLSTVIGFALHCLR